MILPFASFFRKAISPARKVYYYYYGYTLEYILVFIIKYAIYQGTPYKESLLMLYRLSLDISQKKKSIRTRDFMRVPSVYGTRVAYTRIHAREVFVDYKSLQILSMSEQTCDNFSCYCQK